MSTKFRTCQAGRGRVPTLIPPIALFLLLAGSARAEIVIDDFTHILPNTVIQEIIDDDPTEGVSAFGSSDPYVGPLPSPLIGGARDCEVDRLPLPPNAAGLEGKLTVVPFFNAVAFSSDPGAAARARVTWDGPDGSLDLDTDGLGGEDLTTDGTETLDSIELLVVSADQNAAVRLEFYQNSASAGGPFCETTLATASGASNVTVTIPFAQFDCTGATADAVFSNVGAIQLWFNATDPEVPALDTSIGIITAVRAAPQILKEVCVDVVNGACTDESSWLPADDENDAPEQFVGGDGLYRLIATNPGTRALMDVRISDLDLGILNQPLPARCLVNGDFPPTTFDTEGVPQDPCVILSSDPGYDPLAQVKDTESPGVCPDEGTYKNTAVITASLEDVFDVPLRDEDDAYVKCLPASIKLIKQVSLTGGEPWFDADYPYDPDASPVDTPTGKIGETNALYRLLLMNDGFEPLTVTQVLDADLGINVAGLPARCLVDGLFPAGATCVIESGDTGFEALQQDDLCTEQGVVLNIASVNAEGAVGGSEVTDTNPANVECVDVSIKLTKFVSIDGGETWFDANYPTVGTAPENQTPTGAVNETDALYRLELMNDGNEALTVTQVLDADLDIDVAGLPADCLVDGLFPPGATCVIESGDIGFENLSFPGVCPEEGVAHNTASVSATGSDSGLPAGDSDPANVNCVEVSIKLTKLVSIDDGVTWFDANWPTVPSAPTNETPTGLVGATDALYRLEVMNDGNEALTVTQIRDDWLGIDVPELPEDCLVDGLFPAGATCVIESGDIGFENLAFPERCVETGFAHNTASVFAEGEISEQPVQDSDPANVNCEQPPMPGIDIEKLTNGNQADDKNDTDVPQLSPGDDVTWTYEVTNTGNVTFSEGEVAVNDDIVGTIGSALITDKGDGDGFLSPAEVWIYTLTVPAGVQDLLDPSPETVIVQGCNGGNVEEPGIRETYENIGTVTVPGDSDSDPSHYCNPPAPGIDIEKLTNGNQADDKNDSDVPVLTPGSDVTWTYEVTNTGNVTFSEGEVAVNDDIVGTIDNALITDKGDGDGFLSPGEVWIYTLTVPAGVQDLLDPSSGTVIVQGCNGGNVEEPGIRETYENIGTVTVPGDSDSDPSHYCNPPAPGIDIEKLTNGNQADDKNDADVPELTPGADVTWTYEVTNTGNVTFSEGEVAVNDDIVGTIDSALITDKGDGDGFLSPGEVWIYTLTAPAGVQDLLNPSSGTVIVQGCNGGNVEEPGIRETYENIGTVTVPGDSDSDPSHYCNPPAPDIEIVKKVKNPDTGEFTDDELTFPAGSDVTFGYFVTNPGNQSLANVVVVDDNATPDDTSDDENPTFIGGDDNPANGLLDPGETWVYEFTRQADFITGGGSGLLPVPTSVLDDFLLVGTTSNSIAKAVNVQNGDLGADIIVLSTEINDNVDFDLDDVFLNNAGSRWVDVDNAWNTNPDFLPGAAQVGEGVTWTGDVALTSPNAKFDMSNVELYGQIGVESDSSNPVSSVSNSEFFPNGLGNGFDNTGLGQNLPPNGLVPGSDTRMAQLRAELDGLEQYLTDLAPEVTLSPGNGLPTSDGIEDVDYFEMNVDPYDTNGDGIAVIDILVDGGNSDFKLTNSNWVIESENGTFAIFRIRGDSNLVLNQSTIVIGDGILGNGNASAPGDPVTELRAIFVKANDYADGSGGRNSGEPLDSGDTVFSFNDTVLNGVGFYDLIVFDEQNSDAFFDNGTTELKINNGQGCAQFVSPKINFNDVRFDRCAPPQGGDEPQTNIANVMGAATGQTASDTSDQTIIVTAGSGSSGSGSSGGDEPAADDGGDSSTCDVSGADSLTLKNKNTRWNLTNNGGETLTIVSVTAGWPSDQGNLKRLKFGGAKIWGGAQGSSPTTIDSGWSGSDSRRELDAGETKELRLIFSDSENGDQESDYELTVEFSDGCSVQF